MKYWEIIADNLGKAGWSWAGSQPLIPTGKQSSLQTRIAATAQPLRIQVSGRMVWKDQTFLQKG
jgi:hypothetical protein